MGNEVKTIINYPLKASFNTFSLTGDFPSSDTVVIPVVKGIPGLKYGKHAYYFYDFKNRKCTLVQISHLAIIRPGLKCFIKSLNRIDSLKTRIKIFFEKFHYGFSFLEQIMLLTIPHAVTTLGDGKFLINLWSYVGYIEVDCNAKTARYLRCADQDNDHVLGSQQWLHSSSNEIYYMTYSLPESMKKISERYHPVACNIIKQNRDTGATESVWSGPFTDYIHDIMVNKNGQYCVVCELGMFQDEKGDTIPSKVLIIDMKNKKHWILDKFIVAAHAQFDPEDPDIIYFSNHNFKFLPSKMFTILREATYSVEFTGPAAVYKYRLTEQGPQEIGIFTEPDMFRLTNFHVFMHKGKALLAAMGFPNFIYLADPQNMKFIRKITVKNSRSYKYWFKQAPCVIGTFSPSADGEHLYVQTTRSFQVINIESGEAVNNIALFFNHTAANHMQTVNTMEQ